MADSLDSQLKKPEELTLEEKKAEKREDAYSFKSRAEYARNRRWGTVIATFRGFAKPQGPTSGPGERVVVQPKSRTYVLESGVTEPVLLKPGRYSADKIAALLEAGLPPDNTAKVMSFGTPPSSKPKMQTGTLDNVARASQISVLCTVTDLPIVCNIALPDLDIIASTADDAAVLNTLSLRTSDNILGGAQLQMFLVCEDPVKLLKSFAHIQIQQGDVQKEEASQEDADNKARQGVFQRLAAFLFGQKEEGEQFIVNLPPLTINDLYCRVNLELATSIRASVRRFSAKSLYDEIEHRSEVEKDIQRDMATTLNTYGMRIERVSAFQFISPDYERLLEERAQIALKQQKLDDLQVQADVSDRQRQIDRDQFNKETADEAERRRLKIAEDARTREALDRNRLDEQKRRLERDAQQKNFEREQRGEDERLAMDLQFDKARKALELHNQMQQAQWDRQMQMLEFYQNVPADRLLQLAMLQNPQLASAFIAAQQAQELKDRLALQSKFQEELAKSYGQNRDQFQQLLIEATKQLGQVMAARLGADQQQPMLEGPVESPTNPPRPRFPTDTR